jgi:hypothetical protein
MKDGDGAAGLNVNTSKAAHSPQLIEYRGEPYMVWAEDAGTNINRIIVKKYDGAAWVLVHDGLNKDLSAYAGNPSIAVYNDELYVAWEEGLTTSQIRVRKFDGDTWTFVDGDGATGINQSTAASARNPSLVEFQGDLYAVWEETAGTEWTQIRAKKFSNGSWVSVDGNGANGLNKDANKSAFAPNTAVLDNKLYLVWYENNTIRAAVYDGSVWSSIENSGLNKNSTKFAKDPVLAVYNNQLYAAWAEESDTYQIRAAKYNGGTSWSFVDGNATNGINFYTGMITMLPTLSVLDNELYAAWLEFTGFGYYVKVKKFDGTVWSSAMDNVETINQDPNWLKTAAEPQLQVIGSKLYATWTEFNGTAAQVRVAVMAPPNQAPAASSVSITGAPYVGQVLTGHYTYTDSENDAQGASVKQWYLSDDSTGAGKQAISGANSSTLTLTADYLNKYILFQVTPVASTGTTTGVAVTSSPVGPVIVGNVAPTASQVTITGKIVTGETITGDYTYSDADQDAEGASVYKWYISDDASGTNKSLLAGEASQTLVIDTSMLGKYISFEVAPVAAAGADTGAAVESAAAGPVALNGDLNGDGKVTPADVLIVTKFLQGKITLTSEQQAMLDVNNDSEINEEDAKFIMDLYLGTGA